MHLRPNWTAARWRWQHGSLGALRSSSGRGDHCARDERTQRPYFLEEGPETRLMGVIETRIKKRSKHGRAATPSSRAQRLIQEKLRNVQEGSGLRRPFSTHLELASAAGDRAEPVIVKASTTPKLLKVAKRRAGISSNQALVEAALATLGFLDHFGERLLELQGSIPSDIDMEF